MWKNEKNQIGQDNGEGLLRSMQEMQDPAYLLELWCFFGLLER
jgi:hypothetical protein